MLLTEGNLLLYIYSHEGKAIPFSSFKKAFPQASIDDIHEKMWNLINRLQWVVEKTKCLYVVTEDGLDEVMKLSRWQQKGDK